MATYEVPNKDVPNSATYLNGANEGSTIVTSLTDGKSGLVLNVGDSVTVMWSDIDGNAGEPFPAQYIGTMRVNGKDFMVVEVVVRSPTSSDTLHYVIGLFSGDAPSSIVKTGNSANINAESFTVCFFPGTLIATPSCERKVEELVCGDLILVGDSRVVPVKWIGQQTVSTLFGPAERHMPIRFASGSLKEGRGGGGGRVGGAYPLMPHSDLTVTADHAMLVDGVLCEAATLVNGTTITRVPLSEFGECYTVYHVETEDHEILFANGAQAETFVDNVSRRAFDNFAEFEALHGNPPEMKELPYPRARNVRHLPLRIKNRLGIFTGKEIRSSVP